MAGLKRNPALAAPLRTCNAELENAHGQKLAGLLSELFGLLVEGVDVAKALVGRRLLVLCHIRVFHAFFDLLQSWRDVFDEIHDLGEVGVAPLELEVEEYKGKHVIHNGNIGRGVHVEDDNVAVHEVFVVELPHQLPELVHADLWQQKDPVEHWLLWQWFLNLYKCETEGI